VPGYTLSFLPEVRDEIREALRRTRDDYGPDKAREYSQLIRLALRDLAYHPHIRQLRPEIHPEARLMHIRRPGQGAAHLFLYRIRGTVVEVARFRYDAMDLEQQVPAEWKRQ
jgi:plasmid stabilization system protein ParE